MRETGRQVGVYYMTQCNGRTALHKSAYDMYAAFTGAPGTAAAAATTASTVSQGSTEVDLRQAEPALACGQVMQAHCAVLRQGRG